MPAVLAIAHESPIDKAAAYSYLVARAYIFPPYTGKTFASP